MTVSGTRTVRASSHRKTPEVAVLLHLAFRTDDFDGALATLTANGFREDAAEDDPMRVMVRRNGPAGFPQLFLLDPDRNIIEINGAP